MMIIDGRSRAELLQPADVAVHGAQRQLQLVMLVRRKIAARPLPRRPLPEMHRVAHAQLQRHRARRNGAVQAPEAALLARCIALIAHNQHLQRRVAVRRLQRVSKRCNAVNA